MTNYAATNYLIERNPKVPEKMIFRGCQLISVVSAIYLIVGFLTGNRGNVQSSDFLLSLLQCFLGIIVLYVPLFVKKVTKINMPDALCSFFYIFAICGTVLGEVFFS